MFNSSLTYELRTAALSDKTTNWLGSIVLNLMSISLVSVIIATSNSVNVFLLPSTVAEPNIHFLIPRCFKARVEVVSANVLCKKLISYN